MATKIKVGKAFDFAATDFRDSAGNPAAVDNSDVKPATVALSGSAVSSIETQGADGLSGTVRCTGLGTGQLQVTVDVREGIDNKDLTLTADFEVVAGEAVSGSLNVSEEHD